VIVASAVISPPVALVLELKRGGLDLDLVGAASASEKGIVRMTLPRHVEDITGEKIGNTMVPTQIGKHIFSRLIIIDAKMMEVIVKLFSGFHFEIGSQMYCVCSS
jgi:hypothetical protein